MAVGQKDVVELQTSRLWSEDHWWDKGGLWPSAEFMGSYKSLGFLGNLHETLDPVFPELDGNVF